MINSVFLRFSDLIFVLHNFYWCKEGIFESRFFGVTFHREIQVQSVPQERRVLSALRVNQENQEPKVFEDSQDQWSVQFISHFWVYSNSN